MVFVKIGMIYGVFGGLLIGVVWDSIQSVAQACVCSSILYDLWVLTKIVWVALGFYSFDSSSLCFMGDFLMWVVLGLCSFGSSSMWVLLKLV